MRVGPHHAANHLNRRPGPEVPRPPGFATLSRARRSCQGRAAPTLQPIHQTLSLADRFRDSKPWRNGQDPIDGRTEVNQVTGRNEEGMDIRPSSEDCPHDLAPVLERAPCPTELPGLPVGPDEPRLGAADAWRVQQKPHVGGKSKPSRVGDPLAIEEPEVWPRPEPAGCLQDQRPFAKRQVARDVRERG